MPVYDIELNYNARIVHTVEAADEGEALDKARTLAEESDIHDYALTDERESRVLLIH